MLNDDLDEDPTARRERNFEFLRRFIDEWLTATQDPLDQGIGTSCRSHSVDAQELCLQPCKARIPENVSRCPMSGLENYFNEH